MLTNALLVNHTTAFRMNRIVDQCLIFETMAYFHFKKKYMRRQIIKDHSKPFLAIVDDLVQFIQTSFECIRRTLRYVSYVSRNTIEDIATFHIDVFLLYRW